MKQALQNAAKCPQVGFTAQLAAGLVMSGFQIVPEDLWDAIAGKLDKLDLDKPVDGFTSERNHIRSEQHEVWQGIVLKEKYPTGTWVIPCDEMLELKGGKGYCDFVSINRLMITGTQHEMRKAVVQLLKMPDCE